MSELQWTRRAFLSRLGQAGGAAPLYRAMTVMGLIQVPGVHAGAPALPVGSGNGRSVVIIGAGIAGLTSAYELSKAGYQCTVLEASARAGGRNLTLRRGDPVLETGHRQVCSFDDEPHLYFNAGPARLPHHHTAVLDYCRAFGIALEPFINDNRAALMHSSVAFGGSPQRAQHMVTDSRGYIAELLAKAIRREALDEPLSLEDRDRLLTFMQAYGDLDETYRYRGSLRGGVQGGDFITEHGHAVSPAPLSELLKSDFWQFKLEFPEGWEMIATMMQPVGGMDVIVKAFEQRLPAGSLIRNAPVSGIVNEAERVRVRYRPDGGAELEQVADFCIDCAPAHLVAGLAHNFSPRYTEALRAINVNKFYKIAFQAKRRFWEQDQQIYGGISWTDQPVLQVWYPSHGIHASKGIIGGGYTWEPQVGDYFGGMTPAQRIASAISMGEALHPGYGQEVEHGISVAWHQVPYQMGCSLDWTEEARATHYPVLLEPEGRHYLVGDQVSHLPGWQEGAIRSAHRAVEMIARRVAA